MCIRDRVLRKTNALLEGHFVLSSGLHSDIYIQCAKLLSFPKLSQKICYSLSRRIKKKFKHKNLYSSTYAYNTKSHRHISEIDQEFSKLTKKKISFTF